MRFPKNHFLIRPMGKIRSVFILLLVGLVAHVGCTATYKPMTRRPIDHSEIPHFRYEREVLNPRLERVRDEKSYWIEKLTFPSSMASHRVTAYHYRPKSGENPPTILIIPVLGGNYFFSKNIAQYLVRKGYTTLRFERTTDPLEAEKGLDYTEKVLRHATIDLRRIIDWLIHRNKVSSHRIGLVGISMGAIVAALAVGVEPRIGPASIILGGGNIAAILASSREDEVVRFREEIMRAGGISLEQFHEEAANVLAPVDPLTYASRADPENISMFTARFDKVIPYQTSKELWMALGKPMWIRMPTGHYTSALLMGYIRHRIWIHFKGFFDLED